jgi:hypothetical protein
MSNTGVVWLNFCHCEERVARRAVTGREAGVADRHPRVAVGVLGDEPQPDEATPVLSEERDAVRSRWSNSSDRIQATWRA